MKPDLGYFYPKCWDSDYEAPSFSMVPREHKEWQIALLLEYNQAMRRLVHQLKSPLSRWIVVFTWAYQIVRRYKQGQVSLEDALWLLARPHLADGYEEDENE